MNFVQPIRDKETVQDIAQYLKFKNERNYIMFMLGIYSGLRISDILQLKVRDAYNKHYFNLREKKTGKQRLFPVNPTLRKALTQYCKDRDPDEYLIQSREGQNQPLTRSMAYKVLKEAADQFGLECIGTHTLRKTFGYHFYLQTQDVATLMKILNHSREAYTLIYIGITQQTIDESIKRLKII